MRWHLRVALSLLGLLLISCGQDAPPKDPGSAITPLPAAPAGSDPVAGPAADPAVNRDVKPAVAAQDPIPEGAQFTLLCQTFAAEDDPSHIAHCNAVKNNLKLRPEMAKLGLTEWHCMHDEKGSTLCYGYFRDIDKATDPREHDRLVATQQKLAALTDENGERLFMAVIVIPLDTADPPAPKEWQLTSCPGYWTLQIAVYMDSPLRKQYAVDAVKAFRDQHIEAYFNHDENASEIFIGHWPKQAVREGNEGNSATASDPNTQILVVSNGVFPKDFDESKLRAPDGSPIKVITDQLVVLDPTLKRAIADNPYMCVNGPDRLLRLVPRPGGGFVKVAAPSYLIQIRHPDEPAAHVDQPAEPAHDQPPVSPTSDDLNHGGRLRSIGDQP